MQLWLAREAAVPVREQLVTQIVLGILSNELAAGHRLPSTRELARRFKVHANTISAAYKQLETEGWVEFRHGSGVFVCESKPANGSGDLVLDQLIASLFRSARELGVPLAEVKARLRKWMAIQPPDHFLLIEPDEELRKIAAEEMRRAVKLPVVACDLADAKGKLAGAIPVCLPSKLPSVQKALAAGTDCMALKVRSIPASLAHYLPAKTDFLVGIASRWMGFLKPARTMLLAAGFSEEALVVRDARRPGWVNGLKSTAAVICDAVTAAQLPKECRAIVFTILAETAAEELKRMESFIQNPLATQ
ncbi:transcriptional regulator, GntR family [Candidatus Koribacter versatilis Ellin345]|uniref:Transcriptional regulator, GntR family n=1 Tax=Koribacter versatilis (strain Ellin345) TaxID=204669 RepID=Q1IPK0_KORVE|nr:GntR family transcriptional regulator [Candidatus Koribacter versatilis]ABF41200.1 transcriptional regulator, GntR family [Candidatus Koribacter versatilis Ellin345]